MYFFQVEQQKHTKKRKEKKRMLNKHNPRRNEHKTVIQHSLNPKE